MLKHFLYTLIHLPLRFLQKCLNAATVGVSAIVINETHEVLLVKHTYRPGWYLPGGGVKPGETVKAAIIRELHEETGVIPNESPILLQVFFHQIQGANDYPILFLVKNFKQISVKSPEIAEMKWYTHHALPLDISPSARKRIEEYFAHIAWNEYW